MSDHLKALGLLATATLLLGGCLGAPAAAEDDSAQRAAEAQRSAEALGLTLSREWAELAALDGAVQGQAAELLRIQAELEVIREAAWDLGRGDKAAPPPQP